MFEIKNISKKYANRYVLKDVSISFPQTSITSLIGPNGAGKSTLLMMMAKLIRPNSGKILLNGINIEHISFIDYAKKVATQLQSLDNKFRLTVRELVEFGRFPYGKGFLNNQDKKITEEAIDFLKLNEIANKQLYELSGGQKQMSYLAMAIAQDTPYLLLDEPLNNLDMKHSVELMKVLHYLCSSKKKTIILVIHDINFASNYSDYIVALKDGTIFTQGTPAEIIRHTTLSDLYGINFDIFQKNNSIFCNYFKQTGGYHEI